MSARFHTPSFGDEVVFDITDNDDVFDDKGHNDPTQMQSTQMRDMDNSLSTYQSYETFPSSSNAFLTTGPPVATTTLAARKQMQTHSDPNEPAKPISAYGLFFRDTVSAIKQQNPNCSFPELSRIVSSMWEVLDETHKTVYNTKNELARNEYMKQMRIHRQQEQIESNDAFSNAIPLQTKPAVFTISQFNPTDADTTKVPNNIASPGLDLPTKQASMEIIATNAIIAHKYRGEQVKQKNEVYAAKPVQSLQHADNLNTNSGVGRTKHTSEELPSHSQLDMNLSTSSQQIQMLTEAGSAQMCTRESCNKRAIINPDWEDEYCSNECVVIHCRNVFNEWVQSNLESHVTSTTAI